MDSSGNRPKPGFFIAVGAVVLGLIAFSFWRCSGKKEEKKQDEIALPKGPAEDPAGQGTTTVENYTYVPAEVLPEVPGTSEYAKLGNKRVVKFAINVWAGWAPIIYANGGKGPGKVWKDANGKDFQVELVLIDKPVDMGNTFAAGDIHIGWATVDMMPLIVQRLNRDPRTMPRIFQQIDWSNGGDGIVVRTKLRAGTPKEKVIKSMADLRGEKVVLAQNSPSHYFLLNALLNSGVQPTEVEMKFTTDAYEAAAAFKNETDIAAVVTWAPDIYTLTENIPDRKRIIDTGTAKKLIADVWFARADFARDNPEIIEGLVRGILDATTELTDSPDKQGEAAKMMDQIYPVPEGTGLSMIHDAHWTNFAENRDFFMNANNPTNFERTYNTAFLLYKAIGALDVNKRVPFDQIMDFSVIQKLDKEAKYHDQKDSYSTEFTPITSKQINVEEAVITKTVVINFFPNEADPYFKDKGVAYDPTAEATIAAIGQLAGQYNAARIQIEGHTDSTKKGVADESQVRELSLNRANMVKKRLIEKYPTLPPNQFVVAGFGWDKPFDPKADPTDPEVQARNRRVEVRVIPAEAE